MTYEDPRTGFAVELPDGWQVTYQGATRQYASTVMFEHAGRRIVIALNPVSSEQANPVQWRDAVTESLAKRGLAHLRAVPGLVLGGEPNTVALEYEIGGMLQRTVSALHGGATYIVTHSGGADAEILAAFERVASSFRFAPADRLRHFFTEVAQARRSFDPKELTDTERVFAQFGLLERRDPGVLHSTSESTKPERRRSWLSWFR